MPDFARPRTDLGFMRRRVKPGSPASTTAATLGSPTTATGSSGLDLSHPDPAPSGLSLRPSTPPTPQQAVPEPSRLAAVRTVSGKATLSTGEPVARLNRRSSAIGSLIIAGATAVAWETTSLDTGVLNSEPHPPKPGNRPLIERIDGDIIVGLRHVRDIRRIILSGEDVTLTTFAGHTILNPGPADTYITVIDGVVEVRREPLSGDLTATYSIGATA